MIREELLLLFSKLQRLHGFKKFGNNSIIKFPYKIWNAASITIGSNVFIAENSFIAAVNRFNNTEYAPNIEIGDNVCIGSNAHITSINCVKIGNNVLISDRVYIGDHIHDYRDLEIPIISQGLFSKGPVHIGDDTFIGINAVILPGVKIGKHVVVGASTVVTKNVSDYSIVVGNPAKVIKKL